MKRIITGFILSFLAISFIISSPLIAQEDSEGCQDHPLLSRMKNFYITSCEKFEYDSAEFYDAEDNEYIIEGRKWIISYSLKEGFPPPGQLKVMRNYINAIKKIGGTILYDKGVYMKVSRGGTEYWIYLWVNDDGSSYELTIVEKSEMEQEVVADPEALANDISTLGHVSVYGIYFDVDSDTIKPESEPTLQAIAKMLKDNPTLKVYVVGHTDMTGSLEHNLDLSLRRAKAVIKALVTQYQIEPDRLKAQGVGPLAPVSTNRTEEGKKLNRRVELVERLR